MTKLKYYRSQKTKTDRSEDRSALGGAVEAGWLSQAHL